MAKTKEEMDWKRLLEEYEDERAEQYVVYLRRSKPQRKKDADGNIVKDEKLDARERVSVQQQEEACRHEGKKRGLKLVEPFFCEEISAREPDKRTEFKKMLEYCRQNPKTGIFAWSPDRLTRNAMEAGILVQEFTERNIIDFQFVTYYFHQDSSGLEHLLIEFARAMGYSIRHRKNVMRGMMQGYMLDAEWQWREPFGYERLKVTKSDGTTQRTNFLVPHEPDGGKKGEFWAIQAAFHLRLRGVSYRDIANELRGKYLKKDGEEGKMTKGRVEHYIKDSIYYGMAATEWGDVDLREKTARDDEGTLLHFVPAVTEEDFALCQQINRRDTNKKTQVYDDVPLRGCVKCDHCGDTMHPHVKKEKYIYYRCMNDTCKGRSKHGQSKGKSSKNTITGKALYDCIEAILKKGMVLGKEELTHYLAYLEKQNQLKMHVRKRDLASIAHRIEHYERKQKKIAREIRESLPSLKGVARKTAVEDANNEIEGLQKKIDAEVDKEKKIRRLNHAWTQNLSQWLERTQKGYWYWNKALLDEKKEFAEIVFLELRIRNGKVHDYTCTDEFKLLEAVVVGGDGGGCSKKFELSLARNGAGAARAPKNRQPPIADDFETFSCC